MKAHSIFPFTLLINLSYFFSPTLSFPRTEDILTPVLIPSSTLPPPEATASSTTSLPTPATTPEPPEECYHRTREACPPSAASIRCKVDNGKNSSVVCCDVDGVEMLLEGFLNTNVGNEYVTSVHIMNATLPQLSKSIMTKVRRLKSLAITDGRIKSIEEEFKRNTPILCLNLSNNGIEKLGKRVLYHLRQLKRLDLSHNNLTDLPNYHQDANITLDISNNNKTSCTSLLNAKNSSTILEFENVNLTFCSMSKSFQWFNSTELLPLKQVDEFFNARKNCETNCTCEYYRTDYPQGKMPTIAFKVDCAGKQLTEMPKALPKNTIVLNISNNNINVLKMGSEYFENIRELYADNNKINSITSLEGTKFLDNFVILSLRNNSLKTLPMYMLSYIFDRNQHSKRVNFGQNRLQCDCSTAKNLRVSLLTKLKYIPDYDEIYCDNNPVKVIYLDPAAMCQDTQQNWTDYIYYIISVEVILLVGLVLKVTYDYWVFKTAGHLPWPANKMPKLPCDWLCE